MLPTCPFLFTDSLNFTPPSRFRYNSSLYLFKAGATTFANPLFEMPFALSRVNRILLDYRIVKKSVYVRTTKKQDILDYISNTELKKFSNSFSISMRVNEHSL